MRAAWSKNLAGLLASAIIGAAAIMIARWSRSSMVSPLVTALLLGAIARTIFGIRPALMDGVKFSARHALRAGIVVLGLQLSVGQVLDIGAAAVFIVVVGLVTTFLSTLALGALLGVDSRLAQLIAAGTSICGASAVMATNTVVGAEEEDVSYALACVSLFGTVAVFLFPAMAHALRLDAQCYGLWAGASIHEIGQVAAAAQAGTPAGDVAMVAKLSRVALLAPTVLLLWAMKDRQAPARGGALMAVFPWFLLGFLVLMLVGSSGLVSEHLKDFGVQVAVVLLTVALAALGLDLDVRKLRSRGWRPLLLGAAASIFIAVVTLGCILAWKAGR
ncbi:MAG: putative sulfate exporter family transporter [Pseudomonadota bacterium]